MPDKITRCVEEEYSFCLSYLWRRKAGWRPLFIYFRGPGEVPFFIVPFLVLAGLWRFARPPLKLSNCDPSALTGAIVTRTCSYLGSYGMGGPGFVGLRVQPPSGPTTWIVFTLWGAAGWLTLDDSVFEDSYSSDERSNPALHFVPLAALAGAQLRAYTISSDAAEFTFTQGGATRALRLQRDSSHLPVHRGSGEPKVLAPTEDLRDAVIVSRRGHLWLND